MKDFEVLADFDVVPNKNVEIRKEKDGTFTVVEITYKHEFVQKNLDAEGVIRYLSHRLHNVHYLIGKAVAILPQ